MAGVKPPRLLQGEHRLVRPFTSTAPEKFVVSPVRKLRRQSLPARLSPPRRIDFESTAAVDNRDPCRQISAADGAKIGKQSPSSKLDHLTEDQKVFYSRLEKVRDSSQLVYSDKQTPVAKDSWSPIKHFCRAKTTKNMQSCADRREPIHFCPLFKFSGGGRGRGEEEREETSRTLPHDSF